MFFSCAFVYCCFTFSVRLLGWIEHDGCCVCFFVFSLFSLSVFPLIGDTSAEKLWCLLSKTILKVSYLIIILWISLKKNVFFNHSLGCVYPTLYIIRLVCLVYHFNLLIYYACLFKGFPSIFWFTNTFWDLSNFFVAVSFNTSFFFS